MKRAYARDIIRATARWPLLPHRLRPSLLRFTGMKVGKRVLIYGGLQVQGDCEVRIDDDVFINVDVYFDANAPIRIERGVRIADHVRLITSSHEVGGPERRAGHGMAGAVSVEEGAWLCSGASILPGVTIARGCVIAAGALVTRSTIADGLYAGIPARRIRELV